MSTPRTPPPASRLAPYKQALHALSTRTGAPLPSLLLSFAILHEITAVAPLFALFFGARQLGVGEQLVSSVAAAAASSGGQEEDSMVKQKSRQWVREGEQWAERVGRRYGVFGFEKGSKLQAQDVTTGALSPKLAGDVANAVVAYGLTKVRSSHGHWYSLIVHSYLIRQLQALLPVRIGMSLYLTPWFSRRLVEPIRSNVMRIVRRNST
jgi:hypothetical protein